MDFTASFRWWKRSVCTWGHFWSVCTVFWGVILFLFFSALIPSAPQKHTYLLNGLGHYK